MTVHRPIFWHQGLLLQPHHFQQMDVYLQSLMMPYLKFIQPYLWGLGAIDIQAAALGSRAFRVDSGEVILPDGTYVVYPGNALIEARSFEEDWTEGDKALTVFLGLRRLNAAGENVTVISNMDDLSEITTRFVTFADAEKTADLHQNGPSAQIQRLYCAVKIFWEHEIEKLGDYDVIPVAQLMRSGEDVLLSEKFAPPCLAVAASDTLLKITREIRDQIASRGHQLEAYKRERGIHTAEFGARDMVYLLALRSLNRYTPLLFHLTQSGQIHPWTVYGVFKQLIGELSAFSEGTSVMGESEETGQSLPDYDHRNLWERFHAAQLLVTRLLDEITAGPDYMIQLLFDGTYYATDLTPAMVEGGNRLYLVSETEEDPQQVIESLETIAKLGSRESLPILIARALPGVKLNQLQSPPQELPRRTRAIYFQIDHHSDQWAQVVKGLNLALYWDTAPEDLKLELMIVGG